MAAAHDLCTAASDPVRGSLPTFFPTWGCLAARISRGGIPSDGDRWYLTEGRFAMLRAINPTGGVMGLDTVELVLTVEDHFGIEIPDEVASEIVTVGQLSECIVPTAGAGATELDRAIQCFTTPTATLWIV